MPIAIVLRDSKADCFYRDAVIGSINSGAGNNALLCSGFFQENHNAKKRPTYQASQEPGFIQSLVNTSTRLKLIGIHNGMWRSSYINFCKALAAGHVQLDPFLMKGFNWHAKVFILKQDDLPVFGVIGSSNITANAFGVGGNIDPGKNSHPIEPRNFNYECDVYFWSGSNQKISGVIGDLAQRASFADQFIFTQYSPEQNRGVSIETRLMDIERQIEEQPLIRFVDFLES